MSEEKKNCWEYMSCGRGPGSRRVGDCGICPVAKAQALDGVHGGCGAGRACWVVAGTLCGGTVQLASRLIPLPTLPAQLIHFNSHSI